MPAEQETSRLLVSIFYSNSVTLQVLYKGKVVRPLEHYLPANNAYNFSMRKPVLTDPCGSNAFAAWENKLWVLVCGGGTGIEIETVKKVMLSLGIEISTEDFFDEHYLVRNLASLFGIPSDRLRVPKIVAGSLNVDVEVLPDDLCREVETCGPSGTCVDGECVCDEGWRTPDGCAGGECECSQALITCPTGCENCHASNQSCTSCSPHYPLLYEGRCWSKCPLGSLPNPTAGTCSPCAATCRSCIGGLANQCTSCEFFGVNAYLSTTGECVLSCPAGSYVDEHRVCHACSPRCKTCKGPLATDCTSCVDNSCKRTHCPSVVFPVLDILDHGDWRGQCISNCPDGRYSNASGVCLRCDAACARCNGPSRFHCIDPTPLTPFLASDCAPGATRVGKACRKVCAAGRYPVSAPGKGCTKCLNYDCDECDYDNPTQCITCKTHELVRGGWADGFRFDAADDWRRNSPLPGRYYPWARPIRNGTTCVEGCGASEYVTSTGTCASCDASCSTCSGDSARSCTSCDANSSVPFWFAGQCLSACPAGRLPNATSHCVGKCHPTCGSCVAPSDEAMCSACIAGSAWPFKPYNQPAPFICSALCPIGQFGSLEEGSCKPCEATCARCKGLGQCEECMAGLLLKQGRCVAKPAPRVQSPIDELFSVASRAKGQGANTTVQLVNVNC